MKSHAFAALVLLTSGLGLVACSSEPTEPDAAEEADAMAGIEVNNARLMLPPVKSNPGVIYFDVAYSGESNAELVAADVLGANRTELHDMVMDDGKMSMVEQPSVPIPSGETVNFEPGGLHVMVFDLSEDLTAGSTTEVTLTLANGDKHSLEVPVKAAGDER